MFTTNKNDINYTLNKPLCKNMIDIIENYDNIIFVNNFNNDLYLLPNNIKKIVLPNIFNKSLDCLPSKLEEIELGKEFNQPINNLPIGLKKIKLGLKFNQSLNLLPASLEELKLLTHYFNYPLYNLPLNLKSLEIYQFIIDIDLNVLPDSIEKLTINGNVINKIYKFPKNLKKLSIGNNFNQDLDCLPDGLIELKLDLFDNLSTYNNSIICSPNLKLLYIAGYYDFGLIKNIPNTILDINLIHCTLKNNFFTIPNSLVSLSLPSNFISNLEFLPTSLEVLTLPKILYTNELKEKYPHIVFHLLN
jgi:hypothetical protein